MKTPVIDFIVTHYDEPWEIGRPFFEMLRLQRNIDYSTIHVILVQDGEEYALDFPELMKQYPFTTTLVTISHSGTAAARNAGLKHSTADWVMFCDWDDMLADVAAVKCIMNVLPTDDADIIWMKNFREEKTRATNPEKNGVFINCLDEHFFSTDSKLYRRNALEDNNIRFNPKLTYEYESAFNHLALSIIPSFRVMGLTSEFRIYMKTMRDNSLTTRRDTLRDRLLSVILRDLHLADEYEKRGIMPVCRDMIAETIFDMYFLVNSTPKMDMPVEVMDRFREFCISTRDEFDNTGNVEKEVVLDNCINRMLSTVQTLYNHYGLEIIPPPEDIGHVNEWLDKVTDEKDTYAVMDQPSAPSEEDTQLPVPVRSGKYSGPRIVIYCGTYNTYVNMIASAKSLLAHTHVDQIFFLTEDDTFPYQLPDIIQNINVSKQKIFPQGGPNYDNVWSYMCMMRAAFPQMFKEYDRALSLDIDIIVNEDIGHLWDLPLDDYYYAGVPEPCRQKTSEDPVYCNFGVIMMNLDMLRKDGKDDEIIKSLNDSRWGCPEQDAFNRVCAHHIYALPPDYNFTPFSHITGEPEREIITHYAGIKYWKHFAPVRKYATMTWDELLKKNGKELSS